jgi:hypothetical protein
MAGPMLQGASAAPSPQAPPPPPPPAPVWHIAENGQTFGPYTAAQLTQIAGEGRLRPETLVWTAGMESWLPAQQVPTLTPLLP